MPIYRFHLDVDAPRQIVADRLRVVVGDKPPFWKSLFTGWWSRDPTSPPFVGIVDDDSFRVRRDIRYRNSFLPLVRGRFISTHTGTRVNVIMFIHPLVALFMVFWLGTVGYGAFRGLSDSPFVWGMFVFGVALVVGAFVPEAIKAQRLISEAMTNATINSVQRPAAR
ncbi:MAG: hypothetical protein WCC89_15810 [Candidatus Sulfotelmatobacter sp.]|jgi:hypothetical protein